MVPHRRMYLTKGKSKGKSGDVAGEGGETTLVSAKSACCEIVSQAHSPRIKKEGPPSHVI